jgi:hypothetical protein
VRAAAGTGGGGAGCGATARDTADQARWRDTLGRWSDVATRIAGNPVDLLEVSAVEVSGQVLRRGSVWEAAVGEGILIAGEDLRRLRPAF